MSPTSRPKDPPYNKTILITVAIDHPVMLDEKLQAARRLLNPKGRIVLLAVVERLLGYVTAHVTIHPETRIAPEARAWLEALADGAGDTLFGSTADRVIRRAPLSCDEPEKLAYKEWQ